MTFSFKVSFQYNFHHEKIHENLAYIAKYLINKLTLAKCCNVETTLQNIAHVRAYRVAQKAGQCIFLLVSFKRLDQI